jgi:hypothetical protein
MAWEMLRGARSRASAREARFPNFVGFEDFTMSRLGFRLRTASVSSLALLVRGGLIALAWTALRPGVARAQDYVQQLKGTAGHFAFGHVLAVDGTTLVVGDPEFQDTNPADVDPSTGMQDCERGFGVVEIYKLTNGTWTLNQTLKPVTRNASGNNTNSGPNHFGTSVSLRNNVLVVSAPNEDDPTGIENAGAVYVYRRSSSTAPFTLLRRVWSDVVEDDGEFTYYGGVATNGSYIVAGNSFPNDPAEWAKTVVFQIQGNAVNRVTTIPAVIDRNTAMSGYFITNTNVVVMSSYGEFTSTPIAYQLNGSTAPTVVNTQSTAEANTSMLPFIAGDGNTLVVTKLRSAGSSAYTNFLQVIKFGTSGVASWQDLNVPASYNNALPANGSVAFSPSMSVKENQGIFLGYNGVTGDDGNAHDFVTGFRYFSNTGNYYPGGVVRDDLLAYQNTNFGGSAVVYDGTYLFAGDQNQLWTAGYACSPLNAEGAVDVFRPLTVAQNGPSNSKIMEPWLGETDLQMGAVVATNGTYVLAGSSSDADAASYPGSMTLFDNVNSQWTQVDRYVDAQTGGPGTSPRGYGTSADIDNNVIAIGAPQVYTNGVMTGAVFTSNNIFARGPFLNELDPPAGLIDSSYFGYAVGVTGTTLAVGAPAMFASATGMASRGAVYIYTLGSGWTLKQTLHPNQASGTDHESFGWAVDASGNNLIVGIPNRYVNGIGNVGAVQIFTLQNGNYVSAGEFNGSTSLFGSLSQLGGAVSIGSDYAVAGARIGNSLVVYRRPTTGTTWVQDAVITPGPSLVGSAVAIEGTRLVFNSRTENLIYRYERVNGVWQRTGTITAPVPSATFGSSLDIKNSTLVIGDPYGGTGAGNTAATGAAYVVPITGF